MSEAGDATSQSRTLPTILNLAQGRDAPDASSDGLLLAQRLRHWPSTNSALVNRLSLSVVISVMCGQVL